MELIFLRHGQPRWSIAGIGQPNPHLTELGLHQANLAATRLAGIEPQLTEILVSPAIRAQETAAPLHDATGIGLETIDDLVEMKMPSWDGVPESEVVAVFKQARHRPPDEWWDGLSGGESFRDFHDRITATMASILASRGTRPDAQGRPYLWHVEQPEQRVAIVAHGGTNAVAIGWLLGSDPTPWEWERFILGHASIARLRAIPLAGEHVFSMRAFNDREHLRPEDRTR
jgi:probable phosphoglycerate mutase